MLLAPPQLHDSSSNHEILRSTAIHLVTAAVILFTNVLENPLSESVPEDLKSMRRVSEYLRGAVERGCPRINEMFFLMYTLSSMASQTVVRFQSGTNTVRVVMRQEEVGNERTCLAGRLW